MLWIAISEKSLKPSSKMQNSIYAKYDTKNINVFMNLFVK